MRIYLLAILLIAGCDVSSPQSRFEKACIETLKERLKSPSSLEIAEIIDVSVPYELQPDWREKIDQELAELEGELSPEQELRKTQLILRSIHLEDAERGISSPKEFKVIIEYDAQNSYGAMLRSKRLCEFTSFDGKFDEYDEDEVRIDGLTAFEWLMKQFEDI